MVSPYRNSLSALCLRRETLLNELEQIDRDIRARAALVIPCYSGGSWLSRRALRRAWKTIRKLGPWNERCDEMMTWEPCAERTDDQPCLFIDETSTRKLPRSTPKQLTYEQSVAAVQGVRRIMRGGES